MTSPAGTIVRNRAFEAFIEEQNKGQTVNNNWRKNSVTNIPTVTPPVGNTKTETAIAITVLFIAALIATVVAPLLSVVAIPYFSIKSLCKWIEYRPLYNNTLTNGSREKFGRIAGQDYTRWDGKAVRQESLTLEQQQHELADAYIHGAEDPSFMKNRDKVFDNPFSAKEDYLWLNREFTRREKKEPLDNDVRMLRAFSKALIPLVGWPWVLMTETSFGGASQIGCDVCMKGQLALKDRAWSKEAHWGWRKAITFHRNGI
ncbi:MAG: hypothetical protein ACRDAI_06645 [Candidatus Rhabdochlamydia sp.]